MIFNVHFFAQYAEKKYFLQHESLGFQLMRTLHSGSLGVDILFLLSGYLTYASLAKRSQTFPGFMILRFRRLFPVILAVNLPALCWGVGEVGWRQLVDNVFFLKLFPETTLVNYITWALIYEMWFYIYFGLVFIVPRRWSFVRSWPFFWLLCTAFILNTLFLKRFGMLCDPRTGGFLFGILLAKIPENSRSGILLSRVAGWTWQACLCVMVLMCWLWSTRAFQDVMASSVLARVGYFGGFDAATALLFWRLLKPGAVTSLLASKPLRVLGVVSYSLFMTHAQWGLPISSILFGKPTGFLAMAAGWGSTLGVCTLLAVTLYAFLERPYYLKP